MAALSSKIRPWAAQRGYICSRCLQLSTTSAPQSGHNRWSKIKHDKGAADQKISLQRSFYSKEIALASKLYGGDPNLNLRLASVLANAKKAGFPKTSMESAIARGQGRSTTGVALESISFEVMMPPSVAMIIETETDNRARTLQDIRHLVKQHGGSVTPTNYLFQKKGRVVFEKDERGLGVDEVLDDAIEAGAEDVEVDEDGNIVIWTEPSKITVTADALQKSHGLKVESADIIWDPNEDTMVTVQQGATVKLLELLEKLDDDSTVHGVYANIAQGELNDEVWAHLQSRLDA